MKEQIQLTPIINHKIKTLTANTSIEEATQFLIKNKISHAPVIEQEGMNRHLVGLLSEGDCLKYLTELYYYDRFNTPNAAVQDVMTRHPFCVHDSIDIFTLANIFTQHNYRHIPVVNDDEFFMGVISRREVLNKLHEIHKQHIDTKNSERLKPDIKKIVNHRFILKN